MRLSPDTARTLPQDLAQGFVELIQLAESEFGHWSWNEGRVLQYGRLDIGQEDYCCAEYEGTGRP